MAKCKKCGGEFFWAKSEKGNYMPIDMQKSLNGKITIEKGVAYVVGAGPYTCHFSTCPARRRKP